MPLLSSTRRPWSIAFITILVGCSPMSHASPDAASPAPDVSQTSDAQVLDAHMLPDAPPSDAPRIRYERDVRPILEASRCGSCHTAGSTNTLSYAWMSEPGTTWCTREGQDRRWSCFEIHARTQVETDGRCESSFYHRHGEPCFSPSEQATVIAWAASGFAE